VCSLLRCLSAFLDPAPTYDLPNTLEQAQTPPEGQTPSPFFHHWNLACTMTCECRAGRVGLLRHPGGGSALTACVSLYIHTCGAKRAGGGVDGCCVGWPRTPRRLVPFSPLRPVRPPARTPLRRCPKTGLEPCLAAQAPRRMAGTGGRCASQPLWPLAAYGPPRYQTSSQCLRGWVRVCVGRHVRMWW